MLLIFLARFILNAASKCDFCLNSSGWIFPGAGGSSSPLAQVKGIWMKDVQSAGLLEFRSLIAMGSFQNKEGYTRC